MGHPVSPPTAHAGEADLVTRLKAGDEQAFEYLVRTHGPRCLTVARRILRDEQEAQDALQEAFLGAWKSIGSFASNARVSTWLHRITVNAALMRVRSRKARPTVQLEALLPRFTADGHHVDPPVAWPVEEGEALDRPALLAGVREAIERLPDSYRTIVILRDVEGLDTEEAATLLGITPNATKVRLHRAHQALRSLLDPLLRGFPS